MKTYLKILATLTLVIFMTSCEEQDDNVNPFDDFSSLTWWSSGGTDHALTEKTIAINKFIAFKDLSRGVISHEWRISDGSSLLREGFSETDTIYSNFEIRGNTTGNTLAYVLFKEAGISEVRLINTFKDSVKESVREGSFWKVEKIFTITVTE